MCGRYTLHTNRQQLAEAIALALPEEYAPDYNIGPGREALSLANRDRSEPIASMMHWGLRTPQNLTINARIETADTKPRFRESWHAHRCLLPANGFYEWYKDGITKQPYYIYPESNTPVFFAGLWFPSADGERVPAFVILTMEAQSSIKAIHDRMPVILKPEARTDWLSGQLDKRAVQALGSRIRLDKHAVSRRVNSVRNKDSRLIEATSPPSDDQLRLF